VGRDVPTEGHFRPPLMLLPNKSKQRRNETANTQTANLNQHSNTLTTAHVCAYHCVPLSYTAQHRTVLIIFPLILQTIITAENDAVYWSTGDGHPLEYIARSICQTSAKYSIEFKSHVINANSHGTIRDDLHGAVSFRVGSSFLQGGSYQR